MVLGGGDFGRCLGHEGGALMSEISAFNKEAPERSLAPYAILSHSEKTASLRKWALIRHRICWHLDLGRPYLQNCEKFLLLLSYPVYGIFVIAF